ncbi:MAG: hypothetical protein V3U37_05535 [Nitrospinaceae bacterium]
MNSSPTQALFRWRGAILRNYFLRPNRDRVFRWTMIAVLTTLFIAGDYIFFFRIIRYLDGLPLQVGEELIVQLLNVVFLTLFMMTLFSSLIVSLSVFYLSSDLELLHSLPAPVSSVINTRFFQTGVNSSWMILLFSMPIYVAYGNFFQVSGEYYLYLALAIVPFITIPCALGVLGIMALMRYFPTRKAHQVLSLLGLVFLVGLVVYLRFLSPEKFFGKEVSDEMIMLFVEQLRVPDYAFLPSSWITFGLTRWVEGEVQPALVKLVYLYAAMGGLLAAVRWVGNKIYFDGWRITQEVRGAPPEQAVNRKKSFWLDRVPMSSAHRALLTKDIRMFLRDPEQWSQMFILLALVIVYIFNIMNLPLDHIVLKNVVSVLNIGLVGFVMSALISRFVFSAPSIEGRRIWIICTAPVDMGKFMWSKFLLFFPPLLVVAELLVVASNHLLQVDPYVMRVSVIAVFLITGGLVGLGLGLGAMYPMFDHENISQIATGTGGILFMILSLSFVGAVLMIGARPMYVHFNERFLFKSIGGVDVPLCYTLIVLLSLAVTVLPVQRGIRALQRMDF